MNKNIILIFFILFVISFFVTAQNDTLPQNKDNSYIERFSNDFTLGPFVYIIDAISFPQKKTKITNSYTYFDFGVGVRF